MRKTSNNKMASALVKSADAANGQAATLGNIDAEDATFLTMETVRPHKVSIIVWIGENGRDVPSLATYIASSLEAGIEYSQLVQKRAEILGQKSTLLGVRPADKDEAGFINFIIEDFEDWTHAPLSKLPEDFHLKFKPKGTKKCPPTWDRTLRSFISALYSRRTGPRTTK